MFTLSYNIGDRYAIRFPNGKVYEGWIRGIKHQKILPTLCFKHNWRKVRNILKTEGWNV